MNEKFTVTKMHSNSLFSVRPEDTYLTMYTQPIENRRQEFARVEANGKVMIDWPEVESIIASPESSPTSLGLARLLAAARDGTAVAPDLKASQQPTE